MFLPRIYKSNHLLKREAKVHVKNNRYEIYGLNARMFQGGVDGYFLRKVYSRYEFKSSVMSSHFAMNLPIFIIFVVT